MARPYLRPEFLSRIPIDGLEREELGIVIEKVARALDQLSSTVELGNDLVDLVIRDVLKGHHAGEQAGPEAVDALAPAEGSRCTCEGGDIGLPHVTDCPLYETDRASEPRRARVLQLRPATDPDDPADS